MAVPVNPFIDWAGDTRRIRDAPPSYKVLMFYPTAAILAGDWVSIDFAVTTNGSMRHCRQAVANDNCVIGIAQKAAGASSTTVQIPVLVEGVYTQNDVDTAQANIATAVTIGQPLKPSATAGRADLYVLATPVNYVIGHALENAAANLARVHVCNPQNL